MVGKIILQAAQTIVAQRQEQQRLAMQAEQLKEQVDQQSKIFDLRERELEIRDRTLQFQEKAREAEQRMQEQAQQAQARSHEQGLDLKERQFKAQAEVRDRELALRDRTLQFQERARETDQRMQEQAQQAQARAREQDLDLKERQFEAQTEVRDQELALRDRAIGVQEKQIQLQDSMAPYREQQAQLGLQKTQAEIELLGARTHAASLVPPAQGRPGLTENQRLRVHEDVEMRAVQTETSEVARLFGDKTKENLPFFGSPERYLEHMRKLRNKVSEFETSNTAQTAILTRKAGGDNTALQMEKIQAELRTMEAFTNSPEFRKLRDRLATEGPLPESRQGVIDRYYGPFAEQLTTNGPTAVPRFTYGSAPETRVNGAWDLFKQGNVMGLMDLILDANGGRFTPEDKESFEIEIQQHFPDPGPEQDNAVQNWRRMFERIEVQKDE